MYMVWCVCVHGVVCVWCLCQCREKNTLIHWCEITYQLHTNIEHPVSSDKHALKTLSCVCGRDQSTEHL